MSRICIARADPSEEVVLAKEWKTSDAKPKPPQWMDSKGRSRARFPKLYQFTERSFDNGLTGLYAILRELAPDPYGCVVPGQLYPELDANGWHPRTYAEGKNAKPSLRPIANDWLPMDVDGTLPTQCAAELGKLAKAVNDYVMPELAGRNFIAQFSGSQGHPKSEGCRVHLWYMLDRALTPREQGAWVADWAARSGNQFDLSIYRANSIVFTANPVFVAQ